MQQERALPLKALYVVDTAQEELARVSHIATHTLRFYRQSSDRTEVDLEVMVVSVLALYRARLETARIRPVLECKHDSRLFCYEGEIRQSLVNVVANAFDAMHGGGTLRIRIHYSRNWNLGIGALRILVADTGTGIIASSLRHIFEPFFSTKGIGGTGLGLWITKDLIAPPAIESNFRAIQAPE